MINSDKSAILKSLSRLEDLLNGLRFDDDGDISPYELKQFKSCCFDELTSILHVVSFGSSKLRS